MDSRAAESLPTLAEHASAGSTGPTARAWPPAGRPHYERMRGKLPEAMGSDEFEQARIRGQAMAPSEAVDFALAPRALE